MARMTISVPKAVKVFVDSQVSEGAYKTPSDFIAKLVRDAKKRKTREKIDALLLEGLNSGEALEVTPQLWTRERQRLRKHLDKRARRA